MSTTRRGRLGVKFDEREITLVDRRQICTGFQAINVHIQKSHEIPGQEEDLYNESDMVDTFRMTTIWQKKTEIMLLLGFLVTLLSQTYGTASGVPASVYHRESTSQSDDNLKRRTHFDIIWSCVVTLFICTWVAIHPNVPPRREGPIRSLWRRIKLMLWTLVVPELVLLWAYRQWAAARYLGQLFQGEDELRLFISFAKVF